MSRNVPEMYTSLSPTSRPVARCRHYTHLGPLLVVACDSGMVVLELDGVPAADAVAFVDELREAVFELAQAQRARVRAEGSEVGPWPESASAAFREWARLLGWPDDDGNEGDNGGGAA